MKKTDLGYRADLGMWETMYEWRNSFGSRSRKFVYKIRYGAKLIVKESRRRLHKREAVNFTKPYLSHHVIKSEDIIQTGNHYVFK